MCVVQRVDTYAVDAGNLLMLKQKEINHLITLGEICSSLTEGAYSSLIFVLSSINNANKN